MCHGDGDGEMATATVGGWRWLWWWWQGGSFVGHSGTARNCTKTRGILIHYNYEAGILTLETLEALELY